LSSEQQTVQERETIIASTSPGAPAGWRHARGSCHHRAVPTYRLIVEYEGTRYHGWQEQANARSVVGALRGAILAAGGDLADIGGAGRTDAGVHALEQTAHLRLRRPVDPETFRRALNEALPADIHALALLAATDAFHARHDAVSRVYLYQVSRRRAAHAKRHVWWVKRPIDTRRMAEAAAPLTGRHDFALLCERPAEQTSTLVELETIEVADAGALILVRLAASHFLWKMVRRVAGVLVRAGCGELSAQDVEGLVAGRLPQGAEEGIAQWTAPASGLFLERVFYPGETRDLPPLAASAPTPVPAESDRGALFAGAPGERPRDGRAARGSSRPSGARGSGGGTRAGARARGRARRDRGR